MTQAYYEGFGATDAQVAGQDFHGIRTFWTTDDGNLHLEAGYLQPPLAPGAVVITVPARDEAGDDTTLIVTITVSSWKLYLEPRGVMNDASGVTFHYVGQINTGGTNRIEHQDASGARTTLVNL